jgi:hypothetical protein
MNVLSSSHLAHNLTVSVVHLKTKMNSALTAPVRRCGTVNNVRRQARKNSLHVRSFFFNNPSTNGKAASATIPKPLEAAVDVAAVETAEVTKVVNPRDLNDRQRIVQDSFPNALSVDDFIARIEVALCKYGFTGDNCIGEHSNARMTACSYNLTALNLARSLHQLVP